MIRQEMTMKQAVVFVGHSGEPFVVVAFAVRKS